MFKLFIKKLLFTIIYKLPLVVKMLIIIHVACLMVIFSYVFQQERQDKYIQQLRQQAQTGEKFTLEKIFNFKWDEAIYISGEYDDGYLVRERYGNTFKISSTLNGSAAILAFFKDGECKFELRHSRYSDLIFSLASNYISPSTYFTANLTEDSEAICLWQISDEKHEEAIDLESIREKSRIISAIKKYAVIGVIIISCIYFIFFNQYDKFDKFYKSKRCVAYVFLLAVKRKPFTLGQAIDDLQWDEAKLFTHKYDTGFGNSPQEDYYCVIEQTSNNSYHTLVLYKNKKYVFDFPFDIYSDFAFADEFDILSADTMLTPTKSDKRDGYILSIK